LLKELSNKQQAITYIKNWSMFLIIILIIIIIIITIVVFTELVVAVQLAIKNVV